MPLPAPRSVRQFDLLANELALAELQAAPTLATVLGLPDFDERLPDFSASAIERRHAEEDRWLDRFSGLDPRTLDPDEIIDRELVIMELQGRALLRDWAEWRRSADVYAAPVLGGIFSLLLHRLRPEPDLVDAVAARLNGTPDLLRAGVENLDAALASPLLLRRSLGQIRAGAAYARTLAAEFEPGPGREQVQRAGERAAAAFDEFAEFVEALAARATGDWALGERRYDALLRHAEGLSFGCRELRDRGTAAYNELLGDITTRAAAMPERGSDWRAVLESLNADRAGTPEELLEDYRDATSAARQFCIDHGLVTIPQGERCEVVPSAPFTRSMIAVAHYVLPPPFSKRNVGHFFVPYPPEGASAEQIEQRLATNNRHGLWSVTAHEAYPGHHWHFSWLASRGAAADTRVLRTVFGSTFFVEGWGLYSENLMAERGFYRTPEQALAQREFRLFRAARIVVDTSLHLGEMTVDEAVNYLSAATSLTQETAQAEVLRYCAMPTQAASYLTGALEIERMRARWLREGRGSVREFHETAAGSGRLPISLVERSLFGG